MKILTKIFLVFIIVSISIFANFVELRVSSNRVSEGEKLAVKIIAEGKSVEFPKIEQIDGINVENIRTSKKSQMRIVNAEVIKREETILTFDLYPDRNITIPEFKVKIDGSEYSTKPIKIEVVKGGGTVKSATSNFGITMRVDKKEAFVGEPIILVVEAFEPNSNGSSVAQLNYIQPEFKNFFVKQLGQERVYKKGDKTLHELKYLLTPQKSGRVVIPPAQLKVGIEDLNAPADPFGLFGAPIRWHSLRSKPIEVEIKSPPQDVDLIGNFRVLAKVDREKAEANQPINYTLTLKGEGNLEDLEDPVFNIPAVTVYSDNAVVKSKFVGNKLVSIYSKKYVFISDRSFSIPPVEFKEFDYTTKQKRIIKGRGFDIKITGGSVAPAQISRAGGTRAFRRVEDNGSILEDSVYYAKKEYEEKEAMLPFYTLASFLAGMMAMFALMKLFKKNKRLQNFIKKEKRVLRDYTAKEALKILYPYTSDSPEVEDLVKKLYLIQKGKRAMHIIDKKRLQEIIQEYDRDDKPPLNRDLE